MKIFLLAESISLRLLNADNIIFLVLMVVEILDIEVLRNFTFWQKFYNFYQAQYSPQMYHKSVRIEEKENFFTNSESTYPKLSNDVRGVYFGQVVIKKERFEYWEDKK